MSGRIPGSSPNGNGIYRDGRIPGHYPSEHEGRVPQQGVPRGVLPPQTYHPLLTNPTMLQEMVARGPGAYRIQVTIPPGALIGQQPPYYTPHQAAQGYPGHPVPQTQPVMYPPGMPPYYPIVQQPYPGEIDPRLAGHVYQSRMQGEVRNPDRPTVAVFHTGRADGRPIEGSKKKTRKRKRANPRAPKPARYAWNFFFKEKYQKLRKDGGDGLFDVQEAFTKVGLRLGNKWKSLSVEERKPYVEMAAQDRQRYEREMELYNKGLDFRADTKEKEEKRSKTGSEEKDDDSSTGDETKEGAKAADDEDAASATEGSADGENKSGHDAAEVAKNGAIDPNVTHQVTADILVTDDDDTFIVMMEATLKRLHKDMNGKVNLNIHKAKSGTEALAKVVEEQQKYLVITMDKEMGPDSPDGYQTVKKMRESGYNGFVLGLTGDPNCEKSFETNGADATLTKGSSKLYSQIYGYVIEKLKMA